MDILLVAGGSPKEWPALKEKYDQYIGIDRGALYLIQHDFPLDLAIGDFDSLDPLEKEHVKKAAVDLIQAPAEKDDSQSLVAFRATFQVPCATIGHKRPAKSSDFLFAR